ncbi:MAG: glycine cleavage system protein GcvH [Thermoanaerobaculia bacterium]|nr:glycine cleavage system protein GcvH [Thermoanaerobaculia bacterium]
MYPDSYLYTEEHEWLSVDGDECKLGITDFAQQELGDVVFVELPEIGRSYNAGDEIGTIESVKAVAEFYTPVAGTVVAVNEEVVDAPEKVNHDPHGSGWLVKLKMEAGAELPDLMSAAEYQEKAAGEGG